MRIFVAGASGVIGRALVPLLVAAGHEVTGTTRSEERAPLLRELGAEPAVVDVYDAEALRDSVVAARPEVVIHELTDLPDVFHESALEANARIRREGTRNLVDAALAAGARRMLVQSTAFPTGEATEEMERLVTSTEGIEGVVLRYGMFYGSGTYNEEAPAEGPVVSVERAATKTVEALDWPAGIHEVVD